MSKSPSSELSYDVRDLGLAEIGRKRIEWADRQTIGAHMVGHH